MSMTEDRKAYWLGRFEGFIHGISMGIDISQYTKDMCNKIRKEFMDEWEEAYKDVLKKKGE